MKIAVSGTRGFIGVPFVRRLAAAGHEVVPILRGDTGMSSARLVGCDGVVHLAAVAHTRGVSADEYNRVNRDLPVQIAQWARDAGVRRFLFTSSINAEIRSTTPYGAAKAAAEQQLLAIAGLETVIVRPALVYGPTAKGAFNTLLRAAASPFPLPFAITRNKRSLVYVENLTSALLFLLEAPSAAGKTFVATDAGPAPTLAEIITLLREGMGRRPNLFPAPADIFFADVVADGSALLGAGWTPPFALREGLIRTGKEFLEL